MVPAASTMKYMVGLCSKTARHCSSLSRSASSARRRSVTSLFVSKIATGLPCSSRCKDQRRGEDRLCEPVRDLADRLLSGPSVQYFGAAIPVGDHVAHVAHEDGIVRE